MKRTRTLDWKHIRNSVAITVLFWPFMAFLIVGLLILTGLPMDGIFSTAGLVLSFAVSVGLLGFCSSYILNPERSTAHRLLSASIAPPITALLGFLTLSALLHLFFPPPPADWQLIRRFERNETTFNGLRDAVRGAGGLESIHLIGVSTAHIGGVTAAKVSAEKIKAYQKEMRRLGLTGVEANGRANKNVAVWVKRDGFSVSKDYVYMQELPSDAHVVEKIRDEDVETFGEVYRPIRDGWYLYAYEWS